MRLSVKHSGIGIIMLASTFFLPGTQADVYKWVDEQGIINYTKSPPASTRDAEKLTIDKAITESGAQEEQSEATEDAEIMATQSAANAKYKENLEKLKKSCKESRKNLGLLKGDMPVSKEIEGKFVTLNPEQRQAEIDDLEKSIQERCSGM